MPRNNDVYITHTSLLTLLLETEVYHNTLQNIYGCFKTEANLKVKSRLQRFEVMHNPAVGETI